MESVSTAIELTSRNEPIVMCLRSNTGYYLECYPCDNLKGIFGEDEGMSCFRIEQPIELHDQLLYCHAMQESFSPILSYLERNKTKAQLNGYAYGRFFYVINVQTIDRSTGTMGASLLPFVQSAIS